MRFDFSKYEISETMFSENAKDILSKAEDYAKEQKHLQVLIEHIFLIIFQTDNETILEIFTNLKVNGTRLEKAALEYLEKLPKKHDIKEVKISSQLKFMLKMARLHSNKRGGSYIEVIDLFSSIFEDGNNSASSKLYLYGVEPEEVISYALRYWKEKEELREMLAKKYELPPFLKHFATNLNQLARQNKIPPAYNRDNEMDQVLEVLCHRERANSVMLIGEPGVGKTAIAEGLARRIEFEPERIPVRLRNCQIVNLQMNTMVAGTMLRGMFEDRIQNVIREIKERPNLILFIDEVHTMIGAGSALGAPTDAATIFKSVLSRGDVRIIGATTLNEYKEYIEQDEALARRFRTVTVNEPTIEETRFILSQLRPRLERNYSVKITDDALETALAMSLRYMKHLHLPDKPIGWLDTASVRAEINKTFTVTGSDVVSVIADVARIPKDMVFRDVSERFSDIESRLQERVIGQKDAIRAVADRLILNKGPLKEGFDRPDGVLLFLGPTGVGKTELAKSVAEFLFGDEKKMIRIDMSEFQNGTSTDKLIGMPRGIIGSERGGLLTNKLKDNPYAVVLLDEVEKASPSVLNVFLQAFGEGWITDGRGKRVYLSDTIVIMTSNIGGDIFRKLKNPLGFYSSDIKIEQIQSEVMKALENRFTPEFRNRIDEVVVFRPLALDEVRQIAKIHLKKIRFEMLKQNKNLVVYEDALECLVKKGHSLEYGARFLKRVIESSVKIPISRNWNYENFYLKSIKDEIVVDFVPNGSGMIELDDKAMLA